MPAAPPSSSPRVPPARAAAPRTAPHAPLSLSRAHAPAPPRRSTPTQRECHSINVVGNTLVLFGGNDSASRMDQVHVLDVDSMRWSVLPPEGDAPVKRSAHSSALVDGSRMFVFGGWDGNTELGDLGCFDLRTKRWSKPACTGEPPVARHFHNTVFLGRRMYIFGGYDGMNWRASARRARARRRAPPLRAAFRPPASPPARPPPAHSR